MPIDVVVVTFNSERYIRGALEPALEHSVVVIDNNSSDDSAAIARELGAEVVVNGANTGFAAAANQGAALGSSEFVLFLNPDTRLAADDIAALCAELGDDPSLAVVGAALHRPDGGTQRPWWPFPSAATAWWEALGLHVVRPSPARHGFPVGACFLVRRSAFEEVGGFDTSFWLYGEEADLCYRLTQRGHVVKLSDHVSVEHVGGASSEHVRDLVFENFHRGTELFIRKHRGSPSLASYRLALVVGSLLRLAPAMVLRRRAVVDTRRRIIRRTVRELVRHPGSVGQPVLP